MLRKFTYALVACARWETDCILEWIAYHRAIGFEHLFLYCNDDDPAELFDKVLPYVCGPEPFVTFKHCALPGQQKAMYLDFLDHHKDETEWFIFLDIDEFIRLPVHKTIDAFAKDLGAGVDAVYLHWCFFGNMGFEDRPAGSVLLNYTRRAGIAYREMTKVFTRAAAIDVARLVLGPVSDFFHYWNSLENFESLRVINVLGEPMGRYFEDLDTSFAWLRRPEVYERIISTAVINHYAFKSRKDFLLRTRRGLDGQFRDQGEYEGHYHSGHVDDVMAVLNVVDDFFLRDVWADMLPRLNLAEDFAPRDVVDGARPAWQTLFEKSAWPNISRGRPARQSSVYQHGAGRWKPDHASAAASGRIDGTAKFHTEYEDFPWWEVDLQRLSRVREIHVYNVWEPAGPRCRNLDISVSFDGMTWMKLVQKTDDAVVGGLRGERFVWRGEAVAARFVRVTLLARDYFHLDQVEVFGD